MQGARFVFQTTNFNDPEEIRSQNVNGIVGRGLATWLADELRARECRISEIIAEDHGWDFWIAWAGTTFVCSCSVIVDEGSPFEGNVVLGKSRSLLDVILWRNTFNRHEPVVAAVRDALRGNVEIHNIVEE